MKIVFVECNSTKSPIFDHVKDRIQFHFGEGTSVIEEAVSLELKEGKKFWRDSGSIFFPTESRRLTGDRPF